MIDFHAFTAEGEYFLFFPCSARLYQLSESAASLFAELALPTGRQASWSNLHRLPRTAIAEQAVLAGELRDLVHAERKESRLAPRLTDQARDGSALSSFSLYLAQTCNMACCYCWNRGGSFGREPRLMARRETRLVTELIVSLAEASAETDIFIKFYGGEPLLNFPALERITLELRRQEARLAKNFHFTLDTNGLLLEGKAAQFLASHFSEIGVSLDGSQAIHDLQRPGVSGEGTWLRIVENIRAFPNPKLLALRATLTSRSDSYLDTFRQLSVHGLRRIELEYCHETGYQEDSGYRELVVPPQRQIAELREFLAYYVDAISCYRELSEIPFLSNLLDDIARLRRGSRAAMPCGAGRSTLAIDSRGQVFPCIAFADRNHFAMGQAGCDDCLPLRDSLDGPGESRLSCRACWIRYTCAGGCFATHYDMTGHTRKPHPDYCRAMREKAEVYLHAMAQMQKKCPWHLADAPPSV